MLKTMKRWLACVLVAVQVVSSLPVSAYANEVDPGHTHAIVEETTENVEEATEEVEEETEEVKEATEEVEKPTQKVEKEVQQTENKTQNEKKQTQQAEQTTKSAYDQVVDEMNAILDKYGITEGMSKDEIGDAVKAMGEKKAKAAQEEVAELESSDLFKGLSEKEIEKLEIEKETFIDFIDVLFEIFPETNAVATNGTFNILSGSVAVTVDGYEDNSDASFAVTFSAPKKTAASRMVVLENISTEYLILTIPYQEDSGLIKNSMPTIGGLTNCTNDSAAMTFKSSTLAPGDSMSFTLSGTGGNWVATTYKIFCTGITKTVVTAEDIDITVNYDEQMGNVTVAGSTVANGNVLGISTTEGATFTATPKEGYKFVAWQNSDGATLSTEQEFAYKPESSGEVKALFVAEGTAVFGVGPLSAKSEQNGGVVLVMDNTKNYHVVNGLTHHFADLQEAADYANNSASKGVVLLNDGTLPAGDYNIPAGVTLLIPFDEANTLYSSQPISVHTTEQNPARNVYRTLTLEDGVNITVDGAISVSAKHRAAGGAQRGAGAPIGDIAFVDMQGSSKITVNSGGALYAWGFITGSGSVTAKSGATIYENFQFEDFHGGTMTSNMDNGVFPLASYYVQNIEVPLTIEYGATEYSYTSIYASSMHAGAAVAFISSSSDSMFTMGAGSTVTKKYDGSTDRLIVDVNSGEISISSVKMKIGSIDISSSDYELPINGNITVNVNSNSTINVGQDISLLPGAVINIEKGAMCNLGSSNMYVYDADQWGPYIGTTGQEIKFFPVQYAPGRTYNRTEADLVDAQINIKGDVYADKGAVYTTESGAAIVGFESAYVIIKPGTQEVTHQLHYKTADDYTWVEIPITAAKLKNEDVERPYVTTADYGTEAAIKFKYVVDAHDGVGRWHTADCGGVYTTETKASCKEAVPATFTCTCTHNPYSYDGRLEQLEHTYGEGSVLAAVAPTCTTTGLTEGKKCTVCQEDTVKQEVIDALGHTEDEPMVVVDKAPTCYEEGSSTVTINCSVCGVNISTKNEPVATTEHTPAEAVEENRVAATCAIEGSYDEVVYCSVEECKAEISRTEKIIAINPTNHLEKDLEEKAEQLPTCKEEGWSAHTLCTACNTVTSTSDGKVPIIAKLSHIEVEVAEKAATCTEDGYTAGKQCQECLEVIEGITKIPATDHKYDAGVVTTKPTCTEKGVKTFTCANDTSHTYTEEVDATGHSEEIIPSKAATCTETGLTEGKQCTVCNTVTVKQEVTQALSHDFSGKGTVTKPATCTDGGERTFECVRENCNETKTEPINALEHDYDVVTVDATCKKNGATTYTCKREDCGHTYSEIIPALPHDEKTLPEKPATCTETGLTEGKKCSVCDTITVEQKEIPLADHNYEAIAYTAATCTKDGHTAGSQCSVCNEYEVEPKVLNAPGHDYASKVTKTSTCTEKGEVTYTCQSETCDKGTDKNGHGATYTTELELAEHTVVNDKAVEATCETTGLTEGSHCSECDKVIVEQTVTDALGHDEVTIDAVEPNCTTTGSTEGTKCNRVGCGKVLVAPKSESATGHNHKGEVTTAATCETDGLETYTCQNENCDNGKDELEHQKVYTKVIPATNHDYEGEVTTEPTCTKEGVKIFTCQNDKSHTYTESIKVLGHDYDEDGVVTTEPKCTEKGVKTFTCQRGDACDEGKDAEGRGKTYTVDVDATGHTSEVVEGKEPTCTEKGLTDGEKCSVCGDTLKAQSEIAAKGHKPETLSAEDPTCTVPGKTVGAKCSVCGTITVPQTEVSATGHSYDDGVITTDPTCTQKGEKTYTCTKEDCDGGLDKDGHGKTYTSEVPATDHKYDNGKVTTDPTCTDDGVKTFTCINANCDSNDNGTPATYTEKVDSLGHTAGATTEEDRVEPTCTEGGRYNLVTRCSKCNDVITSESKTLDATGHTPADAVEENRIESTCKEAGSYEAVIYCKVADCKEEISRTKVELPLADHTSKEVEGKAPSCTETGLTTGYVCSVCDKVLAKQQELPALKHIWEEVEVTLEPGCETIGEKTIQCERCKEIQHNVVIPALQHDWSEAEDRIEPSCTKPGKVVNGTCKRCQKTMDGEILSATGHKYDDGKVTRLATCTEKGERTYTCTNANCDGGLDDNQRGNTYIELIDVIPHTPVIDNAVAPTCLETGLTEGSHCLYCRMPLTAQKIVDALGHTEVTDPAVAPTCTREGLTEGSHCSVCKQITKAQETVEVAGHQYIILPAVEATCTKPGLTEGKYCSVCKKVEIEQTEIEKTGHQYETLPAVEATCTKEGLTEGEYCSVCKKVTKEQEVVSALKHTVVEDKAVAATCTETGLTTGSHCSVCKTVLTAQKTVPASGHKNDILLEEVPSTCTKKGLSAGIKCSKCNEVTTPQKELELAKHTTVIDEAVAATCTKEGLTAGSHCSVCKEVFEKQIEVAKLGHTEVEDKEVAATCTKDGYTAGSHCSVCKKVLVEQKKIEASGHTEVEDKAVPATCLEDGLTKGSHCSVCKAVIEEQKVVKAPGKHEVVVDPEIPATCTKDGLTEGNHCSVCKQVLRKQEAVEKTGHTPEKDKAVDPTCTKDGRTEGSHCSVCKVVLEEQKVVDATGHTPEKDKAIAPTCTDKGLAEGSHCSVCKEVLVAQKEVDALGHLNDIILARKNPTCTETGLTAGVKCSRCKTVTTEQKEIPVKDHTPVVDRAVAATCTEKGKTEGSHCSVCNEVLVAQNVVEATGHTPIKDPAIPATCTEDGLTEGEHCTTCREVLKERQKVKSPGHTVVVDEAVLPTCTESGKTEGSHCSVCREVLVAQKLVKENGHQEVIDKAVAATCTESGKTEGKHCSVCGETLVKQKYVDAKGHTEEVDKAVAPTCTEKGLTKGSHCSVCEEVLTAQKEVAPTGHTPKVLEATEPTCTKDGKTEGKICSECDEILKEQKPVLKLGHDYVNDEGRAATCTEPGLTSGRHCKVCGYVGGVQSVIPATGHTAGKAVKEKVVEATCTEAGSYEEVLYCVNKNNGVTCGVEISRTPKTVEAIGHIENEPVKENVVEATCTEKGSYDAVIYCSECKIFLGKESKEIEAKGHTEEVIPAVAPTCDKVGNTEGSKCSVCDIILTKPEELEKLAHTEEVIPAVPATCTATGLTEGMKCSVCGTVTKEQTVLDKAEHSWNVGRITVEPTCTEDGERTFTCIECREEEVRPEPALGHDLETVPAQKPTFTDKGWEEYERCLREGCGHSTKVEIDALGEQNIDNFNDFIKNLTILEEIADTYVKKVSPGKDPAMLIIKYIRTGVDRYNSGSWNIMAGYEDKDFAEYVTKYEADYNKNLEEGQEMMTVTGLKNIETFDLPAGDLADVGHIFGLMDISYTNKNSIGHADVSGWAGDTVDLLSAADQYKVKATTVEGMVKEITDNYFLKYEEELPAEPIEGTFSKTDARGDLDGYYIMRELLSKEYEKGRLTELFSGYMTTGLTDTKRASYFIKNRLGGVTLRSDIRDAVYNEYSANSVVGTLEGTREFTYDKDTLNSLRKAVCYTFADYLCKLAGDYVDSTDNKYLTIFDTKTSTLAPGVTQKIYNATTADGQTMVYYTATADVTREDVAVYANYNNNDPSQGWQMQRVLEQTLAAQKNYSDPKSDRYIENFNAVAAVNGGGYNMSTGEPGGLFVMEGKEWKPSDGNEFFAILKDGSAVIGTHKEYLKLKAEGKVKEAIGAFGTTLVKDGKINITQTDSYYTSRASRTAVGITKTGKVVLMSVDGRQIGLSCGASMEEIAQIMIDAGCYDAMNLDGGGSSTYVAKPEGESELRVVSNPSDGAPRSVSTSLFIASTAASSTAFDHAVINSDYNYLTVGSSVQLKASAVSATGNPVDMPEGTSWKVADESIGTITADGKFTAKELGKAEIHLMLDGESVGKKTVHVVVPDNIYFEKEIISAIYGEPKELPVGAVYEGKKVAINENDIIVSVEPPKEGQKPAGVIEGYTFTGDQESGIRVVKVNGKLVADETLTASMTLRMFSKDEASFDFDNATGGDRQFAWEREVSNSGLQGSNVYMAIDRTKDMDTTYTYALDMSAIPIPEKLEDLTYMLPGADMENASAWNFLLQLAERVSVLTNVTATLRFDKNVDVDYSKLTVSNEYFTLDEKNGITFDKDKNTLVLKLNWVDQEQPIDPDTANPLCIVSGIKLKVKNGVDWGNDEQIKFVHDGNISYDIYLRANALYSFSQKPENQEQFNLYPFENPDVIIGGSTEKGGHFTDVYKEYEDEYTLNKSLKDGWVREDGGWAYYVNDQRLKGFKQVEGLYYNFGEDGINIGQKVHTGLMTIDGKEYYAINGEMHFGWLVVDEKNVSYFNPETGVKEKLTKVEKPSTCIIDGHCDYTSESGAKKHIDYDDAGGHEYVLQPDGSHRCSECGYIRVEMSEAKVELAYYVTTYTGGTRRPGTTVTAKDGRILTKPPTAYYDYSTVHRNNINVGTATATVTAAKYGIYSNINTWRGNAAGSKTVTYEIRPDLPTNVQAITKEDDLLMTWKAAKAPGVTYVIYRSTDGKNWKEYGTTEALEFTVPNADLPGADFQIGTRKVVDGKAYESINKVKLEGFVPELEVYAHKTLGGPSMRWTKVNGATQYVVYWSTTAEGPFKELFRTAGRTCTHRYAKPGVARYYKVQAIFADGTKSPFSNMIEDKAMDDNIKLEYEKVGYNGKVHTPKVVVKDLDGNTIDKKYYKVTYPAGRKNLGTYKVTIKFNTIYTGSITKTFRIVKGTPKMTGYSTYTKGLASSRFKLNTKSSSGGKLTYSSSNKKVATVSSKGYVTVKGIGTTTITVTTKSTSKYTSAQKQITIKVVPKKGSLRRLSASKKAMMVYWNKDSKASGYEIVIARNSKFTSNKKTFLVTKNSYRSKKITGLTSKKYYYVKIRSYKKIGDTYYYGKYSSYKRVKVK